MEEALAPVAPVQEVEAKSYQQRPCFLLPVRIQLWLGLAVPLALIQTAEALEVRPALHL